MSGCKSCGEKNTANRYASPKEKTVPKEIDEKTIEAFDKLLEEDLPVDDFGPYSLDTLLSMKDSSEKIEFEKFRIMLNKMTYDERIFHVIGMVDVINGDQYSPVGHSPTYYVCLLNKLLDMTEFSCVNEKFPGLRGDIKQKFDIIKSSRIVL